MVDKQIPDESRLDGIERVRVVKPLEGECGEDWVAKEVPVALVYNGISHVVMMALPLMLEEFAVGFSLAEGIVTSPKDIYDIEVVDACHDGKEVRMTVSSEAFWKLKEVRRAMVGRTGCGICGVESLKDAVKAVAKLPFRQTFDMKHYAQAMSYLAEAEALGRLTGCTHAAVWVDVDGNMAAGAEDVGRHVALDKLLGLRAKQELEDGALVVSSRASYEMVQKAARCGVEIMFAVSAPTALAIDLAQKCGLTLAAFCRRDRINVYTHPERLIVAQD